MDARKRKPDDGHPQLDYHSFDGLERAGGLGRSLVEFLHRRGRFELCMVALAGIGVAALKYGCAYVAVLCAAMIFTPVLVDIIRGGPRGKTSEENDRDGPAESEDESAGP